MSDLNTTHIEVGHGAAKGEDAFTTGEDAARQAMAGVHQHAISAVLVFASVRYDLKELLRGIRSVTGKAPLLGTTTAGEICGGPQKESVVVVILASPYLTIRAGVGEGVSEDWEKAVVQAVSTPGLKPFFSSQSASLWPELTREGKAAFALLFSPGNTRYANSRSYEILEKLKRLSGAMLPVFGGGSADDWRMEANYVLWEDQVYPDSVLVAVFETRLRFGIGLSHGLRPSSQRATITRAQGHEVLELDNQPAAEVYARLLGTSRDALDGRHLTLATGRPAGTPDSYGQYSINVASYFTPQGGVRFAQPVLEGNLLTIMEADQDAMITAGRRALRRAMLRGGIVQPAAALVYSCALRSRILGERLGEEIGEIEKMMPGVPVAGFYSFGEQGLADDGVNRHNNEVVTTLVLGSELSHGAQVALENERLREELRVSEERYRALVGSMEDVIFTLDREQRLTGVFGSWIEKTGLTSEFVLGKTLREILGSEAAVVHEAANERALAGEHVVYDSSIERTKGTQYYQTSLAPLRDSGGEIVGIVGIGRDITDRKRAEDLLRAQHDLALAFSTARSLMDTLRLCVEWAIRVSGMDCGGVYLFDKASGNLNLIIHTGLPPEFVRKASHYDACSINVRLIMTGKPIYSRHPDVKGASAEAVGREGLRALAVIPVSHEGRVIGCLNIASHSLDEAPDHARIALETIVSQMGNAIVRSQAEEALQQSQANLQTLFDSIEDFLFVLDADSRIVGMNPVVLKRLGYSEAELLGESVLKVHPPNRRDEAAAIVAEMLAGIRDFCPVPVMTKDGALIPVETKITQGVWDGRDALFGISRDVTERVEAEKQREKLIDELKNALAQVKTLRGLIPICASCKKIRDDQGYWHDVAAYIRDHSEADFTHGICPVCMEDLYAELMDDEG